MKDHSPSTCSCSCSAGSGPGVTHRLAPQPVEDGERLPEAVDVGRRHQRALGHPPVELGLDERDDVDAVDHESQPPRR